MYPVAYQQDYVEPRSRLTNFFRYIMAIPLFVVGIFWSTALFFTAIAAWVMVSITGTYPPGLYSFNTQVLRFLVRMNAYIYLMTDAYPPFGGEEAPQYPVRVLVGPPLEEYSRVKAIFRLIVGIPVFVMAYLYGLLIGVVSFIAWFAIVITGKQPKGLQDLLAMGSSYSAKATAYFMLLTETYPPITDAQELESGDASAQLGTTP